MKLEELFLRFGFRLDLIYAIKLLNEFQRISFESVEKFPNSNHLQKKYKVLQYPLNHKS